MIIGISGKIGNGKDLCGQIIQNLAAFPQDDINSIAKMARNNYSSNAVWQIKKFGGKLKEIASLVLGIPTEQFESQDFKKSELGKEWSIDRGPNLMKKPQGKEAKYQRFESPMTAREFLQKLGTDAARDNIHPDFWVNALFADYKELNLDFEVAKNIYPNWIITDVRFPNEVKAIKDRGGKVIRINRPKKYPEVKDELTRNILESTKNFGIIEHFSETALDNYDGFDIIIENNGTIEELIEKIKDYEDIYIN